MGARPAFENELPTFLSSDDAHHRVTILNVPSLAYPGEGMAGVYQSAFTYASLTDLIESYERLRGIGIEPIYVINDGSTTSLDHAYPRPDRCRPVEPTPSTVSDMVDAMRQDGREWLIAARAITPTFTG